jgi:hemoglobin
LWRCIKEFRIFVKLTKMSLMRAAAFSAFRQKIWITPSGMQHLQRLRHPGQEKKIFPQPIRHFSTEDPKKPLFERLGGAPAVTAAVDIFYDKVRKDDRINFMFETTDWQRQKNHQRKFLTQAFGGPAEYTGRCLREAHRHVYRGKFPTEAHFNAVAENLVGTLQELNVPQSDIDDVVAVCLSVKDDCIGMGDYGGGQKE